MSDSGSNTGQYGDFHGQSGKIKRERFAFPERAWHAYDDAKRNDPSRAKREAIIMAYYNHPYRLSRTERGDCLVSNPAVTNYGLLGFKVNQVKSSYMDMLYERTSAFNVVTEYSATGRAVGEGASNRHWGDAITYAFERYAIKPWKDFTLDVELAVTDILLNGKGIFHWRDTRGYRSKWESTDCVYPNRDAGFNPETWQYVSFEVSIPFTDLWEMSMGPDWDRDATVRMLKKGFAGYKNKSEPQIIKEWEDGSYDYEAGAEHAHLVCFYAKEYDGSISKYVFPQNWAYMEKKGRSKPVGFIYRKTNYEKDFERIVSTQYDNPGHGKYYKTPSYAESIYVGCKTYDDRMNKVMDAIDINMLFMTSGGSENAGKEMAKSRLRDRIHFKAGTAPIQHRFELPVSDAMDALNKVVLDMNRGVGSYELFTPNPAGGKTPVSATQAEIDNGRSIAIQSSALRRFNSQLSCWGTELYRRFLALTDADDGYKDLKKFKAYLKDAEVPEKAYDPEHVLVRSNMSLGSGNPNQKLQSAVRTMEILNVVPRSTGQATAQRQAVAAINGVENIEHYIPADAGKNIPRDEDWIIGMENEAMRDSGARPQSFVVTSDQNHVRHLFGSGQAQQPPVGHLDDADLSFGEGVKMIEAFDRIPEGDQALLSDKIATVIKELALKIEHIKAHERHLAGDKSKKREAEMVNRLRSGLEGGLRQISASFRKIQEARSRALRQDAQDNPELQMKLAESKIRIQEAERKGEIEMASRIADAELKKDKHKAEVEALKEKTAAELAKKAVEVSQSQAKNASNQNDQ